MPAKTSMAPLPAAEDRSAATVSEAARSQLLDTGCAVVPGVLTAAQVAEGLDCVWSAAREVRRRGGETFMPQLDPNASSVRVFGLLGMAPLFRRLIRHRVALALVETLLGEDFLISNFTANIARPGARSMTLHSDQALVIPEPWLAPWSINIIWCLTDVRFENGATLFIPGSHRVSARSELPADPEALLVPITAAAGSIVAMDGRVWHTSGANTTKDEDRALLFGYYSADFIRPQVNWNAALSPEVQADLDPRMRRWLALEATANHRIAGHLLGPEPRPFDRHPATRNLDDFR